MFIYNNRKKIKSNKPSWMQNKQKDVIAPQEKTNFE